MEKILICDCGDIEHQIVFHFEEDELYISYHLSNHRNIFKRIWVGMKYIFGYKCKHGQFNTLIVPPDNGELFEEVFNSLNKHRDSQNNQTT